MSLEINKNEIILIYGLGESGQSCLHYCYQQGWNIRAVDDNASHKKKYILESNYPTVDFYFAQFDERILHGASKLIVSPGIDFHEEWYDYLHDYKLSILHHDKYDA